MRRYISYFKYVVKHKWFVLKAVDKVGFSFHLLYRCLVHDMSKFYPSEFIPYANTFYNKDGSKRYKETIKFNQAWNAHQKLNKHHHQYWLLKMDSGDTVPLPMPEIYIHEMLCDWLGAGRAINGEYDFDFNWYKNNKDKIVLHERTRKQLEARVFFIKYSSWFKPN